MRVDDGPGPVLDAALGVFNQDWLHDRSPVRRAAMTELEEEFACRLIAGCESIIRLLPHGISRNLPQAIFDADASSRVAAVRRIYDHAAAARTAPRTLAPVVLGAATRHSLRTKYYAGQIQERVKERVRVAGKATSLEPSVVRATGLRKFWRQCMKAAFMQARADRSHALGNARENYKYQYFFPAGRCGSR